MPISIQPFEDRHREAVAAFNRRLAAAGSTWQFPESPVPGWLAPVEGSATLQEFFVVADERAVRGGYVLQHRGAALRGEEVPLANRYLPISDGLVEPPFATVAPSMLRDVMRRHPESFCLGMNGMDSRLARLAARFGFEPRVLPFFVRIENGGRFAREARYVRKRAVVAWLLDVMAATRFAGFAARFARIALSRAPRLDGIELESVEEFGPWADELWKRVRARYSFVETRDAATLNRVYPPGRARVERLRLVRDGATLGWAVLQSARMSGNPNFGNLHVGRITDCFAAPEDAGAVIRAASDVLARARVDVMISNQSHPAWCAALLANAFFRAPSNFVFAPSPELGKKIRAIDPEGRALHLNRGDGDGPWGYDPRSF